MLRMHTTLFMKVIPSVTLIAQDMAPSQALQCLAAALEAAGHITTTFLAHGKEMPGNNADHVKAIISSQVLIVGMSSSAELAAVEIQAVKQAMVYRVRVIFFADTFGVHNRPWLQGLMPGATLLHISDAQARDARRVLTSTRVVATGNPMWENFFYPKKTRAEARTALDYDNDQKLILVPGGKSLEVNLLHFKKAAEIARLSDAVALISLHPGDKNLVETYEDAVGTGMHTRLISASAMSGSNILPGVDWVLESASGIGIEAACQRIPVFTWFSLAAKTRLKDATGSDEWPLCTERISCLLSEGFSGSLAKIDYAPYSDRALEFFQSPVEPGEAVRKMIKEIIK
jgi:hypothetical protein